MREALEAALRLVSAEPTAFSDGLVDALCAQGHDRRLAMRVVEFMPLAFVRVLLAGTGVELSDRYIRAGQEGQADTERPLADEPVYRATLDLAESGLSREELLAVAGGAAELNAINQALNAGSRPEDLTCGPPALMWPE